MRRLAALALLGVALGSAAGAPHASAAGASSDSATVRAAVDVGNATFITAWQTGDENLFASLFAPDGALLRPGGGLTVGRDNIRARMREVFRRVRMTYGAITTADLFVIGDTAYETGSWNFTIGPLGSTTAEPDSGQYVEIWKRDRSGAWLMWRDIGIPKGSGADTRRGSLPPERAPLGPGARLKAIHFGKLIDGKGREIPDALVMVDKASIPATAEQVDLKRLTGMPGMIDVQEPRVLR